MLDLAEMRNGSESLSPVVPSTMLQPSLAGHVVDPYLHSLGFKERTGFRARHVCASVHMEAGGRGGEGDAV